MTRLVFAGPSIFGVNCSHLDVEIRPPIRAGDISNLLDHSSTPTGILVIDGIFGAGQAISVGELREAPRRGVAVFGSTSMGALRAAEAAAAGVIPWGGIASEYLRGTRTKDSDVALLHTEEGRPLTVPVVNIELLARMLFTLGAEPAAVAAFVDSCRAVHFTKRSLALVVKIARESDFEAVDGFDTLVAHPRVWDRKALDAVEALQGFAAMTEQDLQSVTASPHGLRVLIPDLVVRGGFSTWPR